MSVIVSPERKSNGDSYSSDIGCSIQKNGRLVWPLHRKVRPLLQVLRQASFRKLVVCQQTSSRYRSRASLPWIRVPIRLPRRKRFWQKSRLRWTASRLLANTCSLHLERV